MKEFKGNLKKIEPKKILDKDKQDDLEGFFLVLGMAFNDIKGILLFSSLLKENYRQLEPGEVSVHSGEYGGLKLQINKMMISLISEFLIFIRNNKSIVNNPRFALIIKNSSKEIKSYWDFIYSVAISERSKDKDDFSSKAFIIRSNIVFHYDQSLSQLRQGYIEKFFDSPKDLSNKHAHYSLGNSIEETRFFYCDGAVEQYLKKHLISNNYNYLEENIKFIDKISNVIFSLTKDYIISRGKK